MTVTTLDAGARCPCTSGLPFGDCCGPILDGSALAPTATRLMRSRFTAFATGNAAYLLDSWHPTTRPRVLELDDKQRWTRLDIEGASRGGMLDTVGTVEFSAYFRLDGVTGVQHERSRFSRIDRRWFYLD